MIRLRLSAAVAAAVTCLLLPAVALAAEGGASTTPAKTATTPAKTSTTKAASGEDTPISVPADEDKAAASTTSGGTIVRTFVGLAIVLAVIYGLYWVLRQVKASREEATKGEGLATVASIGLGPNRALHLVRAGEDYILVGVGEHAITPIRTYTATEAVLAGLVPDPDEVIEGTVTGPEGPGAVLPVLWRRIAALGGAPGAQAEGAKPKQLTVQAMLGSLREKTVRS